MRPNQGQIQYEVSRRLLSAAAQPDEQAAQQAPAAKLLHSTSWRFDQGVVVLTYAAMGGAITNGAILENPLVLSSTDARRPRPDQLHEHHVVAHAVLHLIELSQRDPTVRRIAEGSPTEWQTLRSHAAAMPTGPHDLEHH